ncbi:MAG: RNA polymerase sigma-70 factor [Cyclobacteriaceae bacterium]|nr:RNA polymerase sigma-70 factor [Cyclobacteriaceae bacterium HetDA_MAG_MS6]
MAKADEVLVQEVKGGSLDAFDELFHRYSKRLWSFTNGMIKSAEESEEIVQDVFLKIWEGRDKLDPTASFNSFIFTIAKNQVLNVFRKRVNERKYLHQLALPTSEKSYTEDQVIYRELSIISSTAINSLPPKRRMIFRMSREQGMTYDEIARSMGISKKTVENQMTMALKMLRSYLQQHAEIAISLLIVVMMSLH